MRKRGARASFNLQLIQLFIEQILFSPRSGPKDEENFGLIDFVLLQCVFGRLWRNCSKLQGLLASWWRLPSTGFY